MVFFVRHNGGNVWFDALGQPWPKHGCFDDDGFGNQLRRLLRENQEAGPGKSFVETYYRALRPTERKNFQDAMLIALDVFRRAWSGTVDEGDNKVQLLKRFLPGLSPRILANVRGKPGRHVAGPATQRAFIDFLIEGGCVYPISHKYQPRLLKMLVPGIMLKHPEMLKKFLAVSLERIDSFPNGAEAIAIPKPQ